VVSDLLMRVRRGQPASLPGLGTFHAGSESEFQFEGAGAQAEKTNLKKRSK